MVTNKWFPFGQKQGSKKAKCIFCFHYAGGSSAIFKPWTAPGLPVEFIPVELPGRGIRSREICLENFDSLIEQMLPCLIPVIDDRSFCLFGHSMGAMIAFEVACQLQSTYGIKPEKLIVAGRHAPHCPDPSVFKSHMNDEALIRELKRLNGTPREILEDKAVIQFLLPLIRSDYKLHESYRYRGQKLNIPLIAHAGKQDHDADVFAMEHWHEVADGPFEIKEFDGNHFFVQNLGAEYLSELVNIVLSGTDYASGKFAQL